MSIVSPPVLTSPFDPALHLHSEGAAIQEVELPALRHSDDLEALHLQAAEAVAQKTKSGIVIQHRAWTLPEVFLSDEDHNLESPCTKRGIISRLDIIVHNTTSKRPWLLASSIDSNMPLSSSPVSYPPSSSPPVILDARKRNRPIDRSRPSKKRLLDSENYFPTSTRDVHEDVAGRLNTKLLPEGIQYKPISTKRGPFVEEDEDDDVLGNDSTLTMFQSAVERVPRPRRPDLFLPLTDSDPHKTATTSLLQARTSSGRAFNIREKASQSQLSYENLMASQSTPTPGKATKSFYGVDIHELIDHATKETEQSLKIHVSGTEGLQNSIEQSTTGKTNRRGRTMLWTEKYRARKFTDLVGDERTHRDVLRWVKGWDTTVFPGINKHKPKSSFQNALIADRPHRKVLLLTGPPGLGKTTLAHVCARQAGYEVVEINASDERSKDVVKGRIRDIVGTENVKGVSTKEAGGTVRKAGRPVCVIVDEVDGVVSGSGAGGEGGFIKALIDLVALDQKNSTALGSMSDNVTRPKRSKKGDRFRLLRPIILICNDVYHPSLRPLRSSVMAEIIHIRRPPLDKVVTRLKTVFEKEGVACDGDGVRRLCEAAWGTSNRRDSRSYSRNTGQGDIRGVLVVGEWVAAKLRADANSSSSKQARLTKSWVEQNMLEDLAHGGSSARALGGGGAKAAVERIFVEGAGFPKSASLAVENFSHYVHQKLLGVAELGKRHAMERLREIVDASGDTDRIMTDCFAAYPSQPFQDDSFLSKPNAGYDWLHFHDCLSSKVFSGQEWELAPYLSQPIVSFHHLFASPNKHSLGGDQKSWDNDNEEEPVPFSGPRADYEAFEAQRQKKAILLGLQSTLSVPLLRSFKSPEDIASGLMPYLTRILTPNVKPVVVGGSGTQKGIVSVRKEGERDMIERAVGVMSSVGVTFECGRVDAGPSGVSTFVYRMEPALDELATYETTSLGGHAATPARYGIRQALDQEYQKLLSRQRAEAAQARFKAGSIPGQTDEIRNPVDSNMSMASERTKSNVAPTRRDFFGRIVNDVQPLSVSNDGSLEKYLKVGCDNNVWVSFHEGFSNAVRKPITLEELMRGF